MPEVPERELSYGEILEKQRKLEKRKHSAGSKQFAQVQEVKQSKKAPTGYIKVTKLKDKHLIADDITSQKHIRNISYEQW